MHLLQSPPWSHLKSQFGWTAATCDFATEAVTADLPPTQVLFRRLPLGFRLAYVPKGPTLDWTNLPQAAAALGQLCAFAKRQRTIFLKIEPDTPDQPDLHDFFQKQGFIEGKPIQPPNTILIDIQADEETILKRMKSKTRYNIRLATKKAVTVRQGDLDDVMIFYDLSLTTGYRNKFGVHSLAYYQAAFQHFSPEQRVLLLAEYEGQALAALMIFAWAGRAYYLYGASGNQHRNRMPTYLLQWEAMKWAKTQGGHRYDLWGIPDASEAQLEAEFQTRQDGLWGVYRTKRGFGGQVVRSVGAFDYVYQPLLYKLLRLYLERRRE